MTTQNQKALNTLMEKKEIRHAFSCQGKEYYFIVFRKSDNGDYIYKCPSEINRYTWNIDVQTSQDCTTYKMSLLDNVEGSNVSFHGGHSDCMFSLSAPSHDCIARCLTGEYNLPLVFHGPECIVLGVPFESLYLFNLEI